MIDKTVIYNIALSALSSNYQTTDPDTDPNKVVKSLKLVYPLALAAVLADLDLNKTSRKVKLELLDKTHPHWDFVYRYPPNSAKFRKLVSPFPTDNKETRIPCETGNVDNFDCIMSNEAEAYAEIQPNDINLALLSVPGAFALGNRMALMVPSLVVGKDFKKLKESIMNEYKGYKGEAQEQDTNENVDNTTDEFKSEFIQARMGGKRCPSRT